MVPAPKKSLIKPDYEGKCLTRVSRNLLSCAGLVDLQIDPWFPSVLKEAKSIVFLVLDGLGWNQLQQYSKFAPVLKNAAGLSIDSVAPTTTATALCSITTGLTPLEHGIVGYRMRMSDTEILNVLRWKIPNRDAGHDFPPETIQTHESFLGTKPPSVSRFDLINTFFSRAYLAGVRDVGWRLLSSLPIEIARLANAGEPFIYAYYDGIDKCAHLFGLEEHYRAELSFADRLVGDIINQLPNGSALIISADHGQVQVDDNVITFPREVLDRLTMQSGEGRFRWLHTKKQEANSLLIDLQSQFGDVAWVVSREQILDEGWLGKLTAQSPTDRLGDIAVIATAPVAFHDDQDTGEFKLICRHGSLTSDELKVPLLYLFKE